VIEWSYKDSSILTMIVLFATSLICGLTMRRNAVAAALSLSLIYPIDVILSAFFSASDPMLPLVFVACLLFFGICLAGVLFGRITWRLTRKAG